VVAGRHDEAKRRALEAAGLTLASEWWFTPLDHLTAASGSQ
jgi:hypothetical protein